MKISGGGWTMFASFLVNLEAPWNRNCSRGKRQRCGPRTPDAFRHRLSTRTFGVTGKIWRAFEATLNWYRALPDDLSYPAGRIVVPTFSTFGEPKTALWAGKPRCSRAVSSTLPTRFEILEGQATGSQKKRRTGSSQCCSTISQSPCRVSPRAGKRSGPSDT